MRKKLFTFLLAIVASVGTLFAESSGTCGENLTWTLSDDGVLTISGTGAMTDYSYSSSAPWYSSRSSITSVIISDGVTSIGKYAFYDCRSLTSVTIPNSVTSIGAYAFEDCSGLTSVTIPNSVKSIGSQAFSGCSSLTSVTIPNSVTSIGNSAFSDCTGLTSVTIPGSVTSIGYCAFYSCTSLTSVTIPNSVTSIGEGAFWGCTGLTSVTNFANTPQKITSSVFDKVDKSTCVLYVLAGSISAYQSADVWKDFSNILPISQQGLEDVQGNNVQCTKVVRDGQIYILRGEKEYTVTGQEVK